MHGRVVKTNPPSVKAGYGPASYCVDVFRWIVYVLLQGVAFDVNEFP